MSIGIPIKVFHEAKGHTVTIELKTGEVYRGQLGDTEDNMNCQMTNIQYTARDGRVTNLEQVYIRGSKIRFMILPDMLKNAPMFRNVDPKKAQGRGKGAGVQKAIGRGFGRGGRGGSRGGDRGGRGGDRGGRGGPRQ